MIEGLPAEAHQLGEVISVYPAKRFNTIGGPIMAATGALFLFLACQVNNSLILLAFLGLFLLPFGLFAATYGLFQLGLRVVLFTGGIVYYKPRQRPLVLRWQDITVVHKLTTKNHINLIYVGDTHTYTILTNASVRIAWITSLNGLRSLAIKFRPPFYKPSKPLHNLDISQ